MTDKGSIPAVRRSEALRSIFIPQSCKRRNLGQVEQDQEPEYISSSESEVSLTPEQTPVCYDKPAQQSECDEQEEEEPFDEQHIRPPETEEEHNTYNFLSMTDTMRDQLARWSQECPVCVLGGLDSKHRPTTADCPLARRRDVKKVKILSGSITVSPPGTSCTFCRMPVLACLGRVTGKSCDQSSFLHILQIMAGLVRAKGEGFEGYIGRKRASIWVMTNYKEVHGRRVTRIAMEIYELSMDVDAQEKACFDFEIKDRIAWGEVRDSKNPLIQRTMQCLRIGLSQQCVCGSHRVSECDSKMKETAEKIHFLSRHLSFEDEGICSTSGMPDEVCGCDNGCRYDRRSGLDAIYSLLLRDDKEAEKWKELHFSLWGIKDESEVVEELGGRTLVGWRMFSRLAVKVAEMYGPRYTYELSVRGEIELE